MHLGGRLIKMAVICQRVDNWLHFCAYMIANTHVSFDTKYKSFKTYAALLQGHNCQSKILPAW